MNATSLAVSGSPSLHFRFGLILIVQVRPSADSPPFSCVGTSAAISGVADMSSCANPNNRLYCIPFTSYSGASIAVNGLNVTTLLVSPMMKVRGSADALELASCASAELDREIPASIPSTAVAATMRRVLLMPCLPSIPGSSL